MAQVALKKFIDGRGRRISIGDPLPPDYDKPTLAHYERHGMVGEAPKSAAKAPVRSPKPAVPNETKPAALSQTAAQEFPPSDPDRKGGENNPLTEADAAADLAGVARPD